MQPVPGVRALNESAHTTIDIDTFNVSVANSSRSGNTTGTNA